MYDSLYSAGDFVEVDTTSIGAGNWLAAPDGARLLRIVSGDGNLILRTTGSRGESRTMTNVETGDVEPMQVTHISGDSSAMIVRLYV